MLLITAYNLKVFQFVNMLTTHLNNVPFSKFVLIQDSLEHRSNCLLKYLVNFHTKTSKVLYFNFENNPEIKTLSSSNLEIYDFVSDVLGWLDGKKKNFPNVLSGVNASESVIVIDSLVHAILEYGWNTIYKKLQTLLESNEGVLRIVAVFHKDICQDVNKTCQYFEHLSTFTVNLETNSGLNGAQVAYKFKKSSGKIIKQAEEYTFQNGIIQSHPINKINSQVVQENEILPENLTTFKISLDDKEKESRDQLILPYLPKDNQGQVDSNIHYSFDKADDWDEEDPDDDLDI